MQRDNYFIPSVTRFPQRQSDYRVIFTLGQVIISFPSQIYSQMMTGNYLPKSEYEVMEYNNFMKPLYANNELPLDSYLQRYYNSQNFCVMKTSYLQVNQTK